MVMIDMDMPETCYKCRLCGYNEWLDEIFCDADGSGDSYARTDEGYDKQYSKCPLYEVKKR